MTTDAGIDIVEVARIRRLIRDRGDAFLLRWFTTDEIEYCGRKAMPERHFAARFAAKEAVLKILAPGREDAVPWPHILIRPGAGGEPRVQLRGAAQRLAREAGLQGWSISTSHDGPFAMAVVVAVECSHSPDVSRCPDRPGHPEASASRGGP